MNALWTTVMVWLGWHIVAPIAFIAAIVLLALVIFLGAAAWDEISKFFRSSSK